jgi:hypothetical protein
VALEPSMSFTSLGHCLDTLSDYGPGWEPCTDRAFSPCHGVLSGFVFQRLVWGGGGRSWGIRLGEGRWGGPGFEVGQERLGPSCSGQGGSAKHSQTAFKQSQVSFVLSYLGLIHTQTFEHHQAERSGRTAHTQVCPLGVTKINCQ